MNDENMMSMAKTSLTLIVVFTVVKFMSCDVDTAAQPTTESQSNVVAGSIDSEQSAVKVNNAQTSSNSGGFNYCNAKLDKLKSIFDNSIKMFMNFIRIIQDKLSNLGRFYSSKTPNSSNTPDSSKTPNI